MGRRAAVIVINNDPLLSAKTAGLRYVSDCDPGIRRLRSGSGFRYVSADGKPIKDQATLKRIQSLVIPPAWSNVWICPLPDGHIQAVGRDAKGRKQYRYHPDYRHQRDQTKFGRMLAFGQALPAIRKRVEQDLALPGLPRNKVLAAVVRLLEQTCIRVGNEEYARENGSYGLTTLKDKHATIQGSTIRFQFKGKSGQQQTIELNDPRLARIVKRCRDIPGYELFQYIDDSGERCDVTSTHVNDYIREIAGQDFTAKDFRTWGGTGWAARIFDQLGRSETASDIKKNVVETVRQVAARLGNRPATCRKYYVHPAIVEAYENGSIFDAWKNCSGTQRQDECVMRLIAGYASSSPARKQA